MFFHQISDKLNQSLYIVRMKLTNPLRSCIWLIKTIPVMYQYIVHIYLYRPVFNNSSFSFFNQNSIGFVYEGCNYLYTSNDFVAGAWPYYCGWHLDRLGYARRSQTPDLTWYQWSNNHFWVIIPSTILSLSYFRS